MGIQHVFIVAIVFLECTCVFGVPAFWHSWNDRIKRESPVTDPPPEHDVTMDPDPVSHSNGFDSIHTDHGSEFTGSHQDSGGSDPKGEHSPLMMSRPGELPPMALPMTQEGSDMPMALAMQGHDTGGQEQTGHDLQPSDSPIDSQYIQSDGSQHAETVIPEGHDTPLALPMTSENQGDNPIALPQKAQQGQARNPGAVRRRRPRLQAASRALESAQAGKPRAPPNWSNKGPAPSQTETAPKGSVGQTKDSGSGRQPPNWNGNGQGGPSSGGSGRQPPNWGSNDQGGASSDTGGVPVGGFDPMSGMGMAAFAGDGSSPTDMFSDMMEMQRKMMFDPRYSQQYMNMMRQYQQYQMNAMNQFMNNDGSNGTGGMPFQYNPMMGMGDEGFSGYGNGMNLNLLSGYNNALCADPDSPLCKLQSMGMVETQIEGPMGEMDMEPGEMDIEGPIANMLLRQLNMARPNVHPLHQEITLNHHVLEALQNKFGVNTTQGIQQKAKDPQFQAFMFQVLKKSSELAPGEFNANLSRADVGQIMSSLQSGSPVALPRIAASEFQHASLTDIPPQKGEPASHHEAILAVDSGLGAHTSPLIGHDPSPLIGHDPSHNATSQHGTFEALVQDVLPTNEEAGEKPEAPEKKKAAPTQVSATTGQAASPTNASMTAEGKATKTEQAPLVASAGQTTTNGKPGANPTAISGTQPGLAKAGSNSQPAANMPEGDIQNKEAQPGLSKDARTSAGSGTANAGQASGTGTNAGQAGTGQDPAFNDNIPIGLKEAGLFNGANETIPTVKVQTTHPTATAFAISAIVLIALGIIIGPIICMLCKMKEKHDEKKRKMKALKNRDISENNIIEAMMLQDLGSKQPMFVENQGAATNYYKNDGEVYQTIDPELEHLNHGRESPTGRLP